jgi:hypothetical protein
VSIAVLQLNLGQVCSLHNNFGFLFQMFYPCGVGKPHLSLLMTILIIMDSWDTLVPKFEHAGDGPMINQGNFSGFASF